jgi:hypothetical protein
MLYAPGSDLRVRVRTAHAAAVCDALATRLATLGVRWSRRVQPIRRLLSPICVVADPHARIELQVVDDALGGRRGARICADLVRAGWLDLGR